METFTLIGLVRYRGAAMAGVMVTYIGAEAATKTDMFGTFQLALHGVHSPGEIEFSCAGYKTQSVQVSKEDPFIEVTMEKEGRENAFSFSGWWKDVLRVFGK